MFVAKGAVVGGIPGSLFAHGALVGTMTGSILLAQGALVGTMAGSLLLAQGALVGTMAGSGLAAGCLKVEVGGALCSCWDGVHVA